MDIGVKLLVSRKIILVNKDSIGIEDLTKDQSLNTFKMYCKRRKSSVRFPDRKARNRLYACHCIAGNAKKDFGKNGQEAPSDLLSSSGNSNTSDGNPLWYGWTLLLIAQQLNAITKRSDHGLVRK